LQKLIPSITPDDLAHGGAGVRAQAMFPNGSLLEDFHIAIDGGSMQVLNAPFTRLRQPALLSARKLLRGCFKLSIF
jgi:hypothetical protein